MVLDLFTTWYNFFGTPSSTFSRVRHPHNITRRNNNPLYYIITYLPTFLPSVQNIIFPDWNTILREPNSLKTVSHEAVRDDTQSSTLAGGSCQVLSHVHTQVLQSGAGATVTSMGHIVPCHLTFRLRHKITEQWNKY